MNFRRVIMPDYNTSPNATIIILPRGNTHTYTLARLDRDRPVISCL